MAKKQTTGTSRKKNKNESKEIYSLEGFGKKELFSFSIGILLFVFSFFLLIAFSSYLYSGHSDFDILENPSYEEIQNSAEAPVFKNVCGSLGAMVAYFFIGKCFGLTSYLIPVFLVILGMKLMKVYKVRIIKWFILLSLLLVWSSVFLSSIAAMLPFFDTSFINPGGNHGKFVANWLTSLIGKPGLFGVLFLFAVFYLIYLSAKTIEYIRSLFRFNIIKKIKERRKSEKREDENAVNEVIETEPDPQSFENPETQVLEFPIDDNSSVIDIDEMPHGFL